MGAARTSAAAINESDVRAWLQYPRPRVPRRGSRQRTHGAEAGGDSWRIGGLRFPAVNSGARRRRRGNRPFLARAVERIAEAYAAATRDVTESGHRRGTRGAREGPASH